MILIVKICKEKLHDYEFVNPIKNILEKTGKEYFIKDYKSINKRDLNKAEKVIICGTSIKDDYFLKEFRAFDWLIHYSKPVLGICGGMQLIGMVFGGVIKRRKEIGFFKEKFRNDFLGLRDEQEVYHLHKNYVDFFSLGEFEVFAGKDISQAVKHKQKEIYGVLFHPEVRQKILIENFLDLQNLNKRSFSINS